MGNMPQVNDFLGVQTSNFVINSLLVNVANQLKNEVKIFKLRLPRINLLGI